MGILWHISSSKLNIKMSSSARKISTQLQIIIQVVRSPHIHLGFHGVELIGRLLVSKGARRALACAHLRGVEHLTSLEGLPLPSQCPWPAPCGEINRLWGSPDNFPDLPRLPKARSAAKIKGPVETGIPSLTCSPGTWLSLTLNYFLDLRNWWYLHTLQPEEIRMNPSEIWGIICCLIRLWVPFWDGFHGWNSLQSWTAAQGNGSVWDLCRGGVLGLSCVPWRNYQSLELFLMLAMLIPT